MRPVIALALALAGCTSGMFTERDQLVLAVQQFNDGVRWGKVDQSAAALPLDQRLAFAERYASLEDELEIMDYEIQRYEIDRQAGSATVRVLMSWSLKRRGLVETTLLEEQWKKQGGWQMVGARRLKGSPLPVFDGGEAAAPAPGAAPAPVTAPSSRR